MAAIVIVLGFFVVDTLRNAPETFGAIVGMTLLAVALDYVWKRARDRTPGQKPEAAAAADPSA
jgi:uncharacterized membrane protein YfcA